MRLLFYSLLGLLLAIAAAVSLSRNGGQIMLAYADYAVQTTLGMFVFLLLAGFILFYLLIRGISGLLLMPERFRRRQDSRRHGRAEFHLSRGMLALEEGDWRTAEKVFRRGARFSRWPVINYLGAARAAQHLGATERRDSWLNLAIAAAGDTLLASSIVRAELQIEQQQTEQAYALLRQLHDDHPDNPRVRMMLLRLGETLKDWRQMVELLDEYERKGGLPINDIHIGQVQAWSGMLDNAADLQQVWNSVPAKLKKDPALIHVYVRGCLNHADASECEPLIRDALRAGLNPELVRLYGLVHAKDAHKQLAFIEKLLPGHAADSVLLLTAGRLYKRVKLWGRARHCLEESLNLNPTPEACHELATMFEQQDDTENANRYYRQGLRLVAGS